MSLAVAEMTLAVAEVGSAVAEMGSAAAEMTLAVAEMGLAVTEGRLAVGEQVYNTRPAERKGCVCGRSLFLCSQVRAISRLRQNLRALAQKKSCKTAKKTVYLCGISLAKGLNVPGISLFC